MMCQADIVQELIDQYYGVYEKCVDENQNELPLYMCFGFLIHALGEESNFFPKFWLSDKPKSSLSVSFLHENSQITKLFNNRDSGIIFFPPSKTPQHCYISKVFCAFPINAFSVARTQNNGCTNSRSTKYPEAFEKSGFCRDRGVTNEAEWKNNYSNEDDILMDILRIGYNVCACRMNGEPHAAEDFKLVLKLFMKYFMQKGMYNELLISPLSQTTIKRAPIQAIFYIIGSENGLNNARIFRKAFLKETKRKVPIVGIRLPTVENPIEIIKAPSRSFWEKFVLCK